MEGPFGGNNILGDGADEMTTNPYLTFADTLDAVDLSA